MSRGNFARITLAFSVIAALAACQEGTQGGGFFAKKPPAEEGLAISTEGAAEARAAKSGGGDVESPSVFQVTDKGLWDGRPSLGGVWVAHASVKDPERVIIRNTANGKSVIGALFRRESANPGPSIQVSSDAAGALGILAGAPTELSVTALRREEPEEPEAAPPPAEPAPAPAKDAAQAEADAGAAAAPADGIQTKALDPIAAAAAAAIDKAEGKAPAADAGADAARTGDLAAAEAPAAQPKCPFWRKKKCEAERAAAAAAAAGLPAAEEGIAAPGAAAPADVVPATAVAAGTLKRAYVQIGIFSVEANAQRAADQMRAQGMTAAVRSDESQGKAFWRVIVGPAASVADRDALAAKVKALGYPDAYPVSK